MPSITEVETFVIIHKELITLVFTLVLILIGAISIIIAYRSLRTIHNQVLFQEWVFLSNIHYSCQRDLFDSEARAEDMSGRSRTVMDQWIATLRLMIERVQSRIDRIERQLSMNR